MRFRFNDLPCGETCLADPVVVFLAQDGHPTAYNALFRHYYPYVLRYISSRTHWSQSESEDVCQDVMLTAFRKIHSFDRGSSFSSWLVGISRNHLRHAWRRNQRALNNAEDVDIDGLRDGASDTAMSVLEALHVQGCMNALHGPQREALIGNCLLGYSCRHLAGVAGISLHAMEKRVSRARIAFQRMYAAKDQPGIVANTAGSLDA